MTERERLMEALRNVENMAIGFPQDAPERIAARKAFYDAVEALLVALLNEYIAEWREAYSTEFFGDKTDWDSLDENGKRQAQRNAAGMMRHWANRLEQEGPQRAARLLGRSETDD